jgi:hypothetical protein
MKMDDDLWDGEDEEVLITSDEESLYNNDFKRALVKCDKRVIFTDHEIKRLKALDDAMIEMEHQIWELIEKSVEENELENENEAKPYYEEAVRLNIELGRIGKQAQTIQLAAENRFMKKQFGEDFLGIVCDTEEILSKGFSNYSELMVQVHLMKESKETEVKLFINALRNDISMHINYLMKNNKIREIGIPIALKAKQMFGSTQHYDALIIKQIHQTLNDVTSPQKEVESTLNFEVIRQGPLTGWLSTLSSKGHAVDVDYVYQRVKMEHEGLTVYLENHLETSFDVVTLQFIDMLIVEYNNMGRNNATINISLETYMNRRGISAPNKARVQVKRILKNLSNIRLEYDLGNESRKKTKLRIYDMRILSDEGTIRNSTITTKLSDDFCRLIREFKIMQFPTKLYTFNENENPHSYYLLKKLAWHKNINFNHDNADTLTVRKLIEVCPQLPSYDSIVKTGQIKQRIMEPFNRDMNAFSDVLTWDYYQDNMPISKEQAINMDYFSFIQLKIKVTWIDYPISRSTR